VAADRFFILDDVKLDADGQLSRETDELDLMLGRQGNVLLANGQRKRQIGVVPGTRERWRFANSANGRYFNLRMVGHPFLVIGWDGGLIETPYAADTVLIAPGERYDVLVDFDGEPGTHVTLDTIYYDRGHNIPDEGPKPLFEVVYGDQPGDAPKPALPSSWGAIERLAVGASTASRSFVLDEVEEADGPRFTINGMSWPATPPVVLSHGATEIWQVRNDSEMDHPIHLHGLFFQVLDSAGHPETRLGWKDTVNVLQKSTLRFAVRYDLEGTWTWHCHILEHAERGMMQDLVVQ
jgi:FtsP/CotA-like multicopper oxidase with cupredoxin domain